MAPNILNFITGNEVNSNVGIHYMLREFNLQFFSLIQQ